MSRPPITPVLARAWRLECPRCGVGRLYRKDVRMFRHCPICGLNFYPESGFYLGAMILNYVVTVVIVLAVYFVSVFIPEFLPWSVNVKIMLWMVFAIALSLLLFRQARSFWLALNYWVEPYDIDESGKGRY
jgi:uncharacterized protein (DUF983 family)